MSHSPIQWSSASCNMQLCVGSFCGVPPLFIPLGLPSRLPPPPTLARARDLDYIGCGRRGVMYLYCTRMTGEGNDTFCNGVLAFRGDIWLVVVL